jgi:hypothetical protein
MQNLKEELRAEELAATAEATKEAKLDAAIETLRGAMESGTETTDFNDCDPKLQQSMEQMQQYGRSRNRRTK